MLCFKSRAIVIKRYISDSVCYCRVLGMKEKSGSIKILQLTGNVCFPLNGKKLDIPYLKTFFWRLEINYFKNFLHLFLTYKCYNLKLA